MGRDAAHFLGGVVQVTPGLTDPKSDYRTKTTEALFVANLA